VRQKKISNQGLFLIKKLNIISTVNKLGKNHIGTFTFRFPQNNPRSDLRKLLKKTSSIAYTLKLNMSEIK
jgi:hypothetical protein